jgi:replicative DNA helicase
MSLQDSSINTLSRYGQNFQTKCIVSLLNDRAFTEQILDILNPAFFDSDANQWAVSKIIWYFQTYRTVPTMEVFKKEVDKISDDATRAGVVEQLRIIYRNENQKADDQKYVKDEFLMFCKNQAIKNAIEKSIDLLQRGDYNQIKAVVDKAMHAGQERNLGHNYLEDGSTRWTKVTRNTVATRWAVINELLDGGLGAGEMGCVVAPSGIGKSWVLTNIGAAAAAYGKKVVHYTFELSETYSGLRYDTTYTGIEPNKVGQSQDAVEKIMQEIQGQVFIKYFPTRTCTINHLRAHLQRLENMGNKPDLVIIDYADLMRSITKANARYEELGYIYEEIRGTLGELKIPGWTASQSQRSSLQDDVVEADKIAGSYEKIMACDFIMSLSRKMADKLSNTARVHIIKNRFGPDGMTLPAHLDLSKGEVEIFDENSSQGIKIKQRMQSGDGAVTRMMAQRLLHQAKNVPANVDDDD